MKRLLILLVLLCGAAFAQGEQKMAVYATGSLGANEKRALNLKMLSSFAGSGKYKAIESQEAFFSGLQEYEKGNALENSQIIAFGKQMGAQNVCLLSIMPAFGSHHITAQIVDVETQEVLAMGEAGSALKSLDDLAELASELSSQLFYALQPSKRQSAAAAPAGSATPAAAEPQQCKGKYNINELLAKVQNGFPKQLGDCGSSFAKDLAKSKIPFSKTPAPEPKSYLTQCTMDGIKGRLPDGFPGVDKAVGDIQKFLGTVLNTALAGGVPNPTSLLNAAKDMDGLLNSIKNLKSHPCVVDEPYEYVEEEEEEEDDDENGGSSSDKNKFFTLGFRLGMNSSHFNATYERYYGERRYGNYEGILGFQFGLAFDLASSSSKVFHLQPGLMYIQKGSGDKREGSRNEFLTTHNIEIPLLFSLKFSVLRVNAGLYYDICLKADDSDFDNNDFGASYGFGFDLGKFYIGAFYDYGFISINHTNYMDHYNRAFGLNFGVNL